MTTHGLHAFDSTLQDANAWLRAVMERLDTDDEHLGMSALRNTLHALRDRIGSGNAAHFGAQLPTVLRGVYYENFQPAREQSRERHQAAFLAHIAAESRTTAAFDPERAARAVFDVMWERMDPGEIAKLVRAMPEELRDLWPDGARARAAKKERKTGKAGL